jgi:DNA-binding GntR family transcriptional regulator
MTPNTSVLADYAYTEILRRILSAEIKPGARVREDVLAEQLGISRTPVREAVNRLVQNGFITNIKRKGLYCVQFTRHDFLNLVELRSRLETLSFEKCIDLATPEDITAVQAIIDGFEQKFAVIMGQEEDTRSKEMALLHNDYDVRFHVGIARVSDSERLIQYVSEVENMLLIARQWIYLSEARLEILQVSWKQHQQMVDAIRERDKERACDLLRQHLDVMLHTQIELDDGV